MWNFKKFPNLFETMYFHLCHQFHRIITFVFLWVLKVIFLSFWPKYKRLLDVVIWSVALISGMLCLSLCNVKLENCILSRKSLCHIPASLPWASGLSDFVTCPSLSPPPELCGGPSAPVAFRCLGFRVEACRGL